MKIGKTYLRDVFGWPVETYKGFYPLTNFIRLVLHTSPSKTWKYRGIDRADPNPPQQPNWDTYDRGCGCCQAKEHE